MSDKRHRKKQDVWFCIVLFIAKNLVKIGIQMVNGETVGGGCFLRNIRERGRQASPERRRDKKNLWRRKCVRRAIFRNVEVRVERGFAPFNPYFVCNASNCVTVRPVRGHLTPKMNIAFFIRNLMPNIFLIDNFFEKSCIFRGNRKKLFWGCI